MSLQKIKANISIGIVLSYGLIAILLRYINPQDPEIFPIFSWRLFAGIPNTKTEFVVEITKYKDLNLEKPTPFSEAVFLKASKSVAARKLIQDFANSYNTHAQDYEKYQRALELIYLENTQEYRLVKKTYNPIERYYSRPISNDTIATFKTNVN